MKRYFRIAFLVVSILPLLLSGCAVDDPLEGDLYITGKFYSNGVEVGTDPDVFTTTEDGLVPAPGVSAGDYLKDDGTWDSPAGAGDMTKAVYDVDSNNIVDTATNQSGGTVSATSVTDSGLTSGRVPIAGVGGLLGDDADLTFSTDTLLATKVQSSSLTSGRDVVTSTNGLLIDKVISGSTFPASPKTGDLFIHSTTGRKVLYSYEGSSWIPMQSLGTMTMYVDTTDGTDDTSHGTAVDAGAFKTVQYAVSTIPGLIGGNVQINIAAGTYAETVTIQGKTFIDNYSITLQGTLTTVSTAAQESSVQGATTTMGSITDTGAFTGHANKLLYSSNNAEYRVIDSVTADVATIVGYWTAAPSGNYTIYDWGTIISALVIKPGQLGIVVNDISFNAAGGALSQQNYTSATYTRCSFASSTTHAVVVSQAGATFNYSYFLQTGTASSLTSTNFAATYMIGVKIANTNNSGASALKLTANSITYFATMLSIIDGDAGGGNKATIGIDINRRSLVSFELRYNVVRNCDTGVYCDYGSTGMYSSNNQYSGNTADETANATTYSYID